MSDWSQQLAEELHKPISRNFRKRRVISHGIDKIWAADLVEMQKYSKWNKGIKYLLMVIDVFSKYGWIVPLKDKKTESVSLAFDHIFKKSKRKPEKLWTDKGSEFISKHFKNFLKRNNIMFYYISTEIYSLKSHVVNFRSEISSGQSEERTTFFTCEKNRSSNQKLRTIFFHCIG